MSKGKFEHTAPHRRRGIGTKTVVLVLALTLALGCAIGGTLAWLLDKSDNVTNTFTPSNINITLTETKNKDEREFKMIPGWTIDKDPVVTVKKDSEDCWLFVKVEESTTPVLSKYIAYAIDEDWTQGAGDCTCEAADHQASHGVPENVYFRKVAASAEDQKFVILGAGTYTYDNGTTDDTKDDVTVKWEADHVGVKPEVTKEMMDDLATAGATQPTLTFTAYASQLYSSNAPKTEFTPAQAWANINPASGN